jgi:hypothetical protein
MLYLDVFKIGEIAAAFGQADFRNRRARSGPICSLGASLDERRRHR